MTLIATQAIIHLINAQLFIYLQSVQAYISPPSAVCRVLHLRHPLASNGRALRA